LSGGGGGGTVDDALDTGTCSLGAGFGDRLHVLELVWAVDDLHDLSEAAVVVQPETELGPEVGGAPLECVGGGGLDCVVGHVTDGVAVVGADSGLGVDGGLVALDLGMDREPDGGLGHDVWGLGFVAAFLGALSS